MLSFFRTDFSNSTGTLVVFDEDLSFGSSDDVDIALTTFVVEWELLFVWADDDSEMEFVADDEAVAVELAVCSVKAWAIGCKEPFFNTKHVRSGFVVPGEIDVLKMC